MAASDTVAVTYVAADRGSIIYGKSKAPQAFRDAGIINKLKDSGIKTTEQSALDQPASWSSATFLPGRVRREDTNLKVCQKVKIAVATALATGSETPPFQLVLGGECSMLPAIMSAFWNQKPARRVGLIYVDANTDLLQPTEPASSGNLAAMTKTHLIRRGGALESMKEFSREDGTPVCDANNTVLFGINMAYQGNTREHFTYLFDNNYKVVSSSSVARDPVQRAEESLGYLEDKVDMIVVHLDVNSIDPRSFPSAILPNATGEISAILKALKVLLKSPKAGGLSIAEVNPDRDPELKMTGRLVDEIVHGLKGRMAAAN